MTQPTTDPSCTMPASGSVGNRHGIREKVVLREQIVQRLNAGYTTKSRLVIELRTSLRLTNDVLALLEEEALVESFTMLSGRGRLDMFWCLPGQAPFPKASTLPFRADETLKAMQEHAAFLASRGTRQ